MSPTTATSVVPDEGKQEPSRPEPSQWAMGTEAFERRMPHHDGIRALWETKWRGPCTAGVYPFHDGQLEDFAPVFQSLIVEHGDVVKEGTEHEYTRAFFGGARDLERRGDEAAAAGDVEGASRLYLRAACLLRIARFPYISGHPRVSDPVKWEAWERQKDVYMKAARSWPQPVIEVPIPHVYARGGDRDVIPAYVRVPAPSPSAEAERCPVVILLTGLDGYRPDNTARCDAFLARGWAAVVLEIPGTADCPADPADPLAADRLLDSVFAWLDGCAASASFPGAARLDAGRVMMWGLSSGGYYAVRAAHTHRARLRGAVAQGAGTHHFFARGWLARADGHEYPFRLLPALAAKHGFPGDVEGYLREAQARFSLVASGIVQGPSARLLLINGTHDGLMPIEDSTLLFEYGSPKEARFFPGALHMGYPLANDSVYPWMEQVMASAQ
ncbi:alpha/beta-hydrolase [Durotheca rogersii]|uniref:alpha/beta-hydrolase n=1 Tax=Durotheca rogersii TaxID=419775 RepID=UPI00222074B9|nr:alpha/beta-hydrolase [Durotheca rogersii]KAI5860974.1 alpha/beta-hydrolase [Durotheca rogersii]